jgi:hypothetical protein
MMLREGRGPYEVDSPWLPPAAGTTAQHDIVFTFYGETWRDAQRRAMYMAGDRPLVTLLRSPLVGSLLVANPYRSRPIQWARRIRQRRGDELLPVALDIPSHSLDLPAAERIGSQGATVATNSGLTE